MIHTIEIKIRGYHLDYFGHVNNARYLEFMEEARWAAFEGKTDLHEMGRMGYAFTVVNINISYRRAALMNDVVQVETEVTRWGRRSAVIHQVIRNKATGQALTEAEVTFVIVDTRSQKAITLEGPVLAMLKGEQ